jgi:hypothetical protein
LVSRPGRGSESGHLTAKEKCQELARAQATFARCHSDATRELSDDPNILGEAHQNGGSSVDRLSMFDLRHDWKSWCGLERATVATLALGLTLVVAAWVVV